MNALGHNVWHDRAVDRPRHRRVALSPSGPPIDPEVRPRRGSHARFAIAATATWWGVALVAGCGANVDQPATAKAAESTAPDAQRKLMNPKLADGTPVMLGFDSHHPDCFTFPSQAGGDSEKVDCPDGVTGLLDDCRGARLYAAGSACKCVPVSGDEPTEVRCPDAISSP